jgi:hypothetical protein
MDVRMMDA